MRSLDDVMSRLTAMQVAAPEAVVEALCRVETQRGHDDDALGSLLRFGAELTRVIEPEHDASVDDPFPDYDKPAAPSHDNAAPHLDAAAAGMAGHDQITQALLGTLTEYQALLERHRRDFDEVFQRRAAGVEEHADDTIRRLQAAQLALLKYPIAAQAAFAAMVREGRRYAETDDGQIWKRRLAGSAMLAKARTLFEGLSSGLLSEDGAALPSTYVDGFLKALDRNLEDVLGELGGVGKVP